MHPASSRTARHDARRSIWPLLLGGRQPRCFAIEDSRCKAGIDVDGAPHGSAFKQDRSAVFMFLLSDHIHESDPRPVRSGPTFNRLTIGCLRRDGYASRFVAPNISSSVTMEPVEKPYRVCGRFRILGILGIDGRRQLAVRRTACGAFSDAYLKEQVFRGSRFHLRSIPRSKFSSEAPVSPPFAGITGLLETTG